MTAGFSLPDLPGGDSPRPEFAPPENSEVPAEEADADDGVAPAPASSQTRPFHTGHIAANR